MIAPFVTGIALDTESWISPPDSFEQADNVHVRHGFIQKRFGYIKFGHMKTTETNKVISGITQANPGVVTTTASHGYTTGDRIYIANVVGMVDVNNRLFSITVLTATTFSLGIDTSGYAAYVSDGTAGKQADSTDRVMGLTRFVQPDGTESSLAFNTTRANVYSGATFDYTVLDSGPIMSGGSLDYIWAINWTSSSIVPRLYFTNGLPLDGSNLNGIRYYDGTTSTTVALLPKSTSASNDLVGAKLLFVLDSRLIALNTFEKDSGTGTVTNHAQRARWCGVNNPGVWSEPTVGNGGFVDAGTGDQIISGKALSNQIIVFFTNSVWTLRSIPSNEIAPFRWYKINDFRACDGKMASVGFDRFVIAAGTRGITATDGVETRRVDQKIGTFTSTSINADQFQKVFGLRSYTYKRTWLLYADLEQEENNRALVNDDESQAYTTYTISLNCLGYGNFKRDLAINDFVAPNLDLSIDECGEDTIQDYSWQNNGETMLGGNITGQVYMLENGANDDGEAIPTTILSANWNPFKNEGAAARLNYVDIYVDCDTRTKATVEFYKDDMQDAYATKEITFLPNLNFVENIQAITQSNPAIVLASNNGLVTGDIIYIYGVDGMRTINEGPYTISVIDSNTFSLNGVDSSGFNPYTGGGSVYRRGIYKDKTWKRVFGGGIGYTHQIKITSNGTDMPVHINAFKPDFSPFKGRMVGE
jgi:hypothetical protein